MARLLIIEDAKFMRMTLSTKAGHEVISEGGNGREAME